MKSIVNLKVKILILLIVSLFVNLDKVYSLSDCFESRSDLYILEGKSKKKKVSHTNFNYEKFFTNKKVFRDKKISKALSSIRIKRKSVEKNLAKAKKSKSKSARRIEFSAYNVLVGKVIKDEAKIYSKIIKKTIRKSKNKEKAKVYLKAANNYQSKLKKLLRQKSKLDKKRKKKNSDENFKLTKKIVGLGELMIMELRKSIMAIHSLKFSSYMKKSPVTKKKKVKKKKVTKKKKSTKKKKKVTKPKVDPAKVKELKNLKLKLSKLQKENAKLKSDLNVAIASEKSKVGSEELRKIKDNYETTIKELKSQLSSKGSVNRVDASEKEIFYFNGISGKNLYKDKFIPNVRDELPRGIAFKIQVAISSYKVDKSKYSKYGRVSIMYENGYYKYMIGLFRTYQVAEIAKNVIREQGVGDAFVVAFYDGGIVPYEKAVQNLAKYATDVESDYYLAFERESAYLVKALKDGFAGTKTQPRKRQKILVSSVAKQKGVRFLVQLGAYKSKVNISKFGGLGKIFVSSGAGMTKYFAGSFKKYSDVLKHKKNVIRKGFSKSFIVAYRDGKRIPVDEARILNNN